MDIPYAKLLGRAVVRLDKYAAVLTTLISVVS